MTFSVNRAALERELALLQVVAERKATMPALGTVLMRVEGETLTLTATDIDTTLLTTVAATGDAWAGCLPSKQLYELTRLLRDESIELTEKENGRVAVKCGKSKHLLPYLDAAQFPQAEQPELAYETLDGPTLREAIERAMRCISTDAVEQWMRGVAMRSYDDGLYIVATNSRQTAVTNIATALKADALVPVRAASALVKLLSDGDVQVSISSNQATFKQAHHTFSTRLMDVKFPDWRPLLPATFDHAVTLDPEATRQAFKLAAITAKETALIPVPIRLTIKRDELLVATEESERGHSAEVVAISCPTLNGDGLTRGVNGQHFIGFLDGDTNAVMSFNNDLRLVQLSPEGQPNYRYITMALKV